MNTDLAHPSGGLRRIEVRRGRPSAETIEQAAVRTNIMRGETGLGAKGPAVVGPVAIFQEVSDMIATAATDVEPEVWLHDLRQPLTAIKGHVQQLERTITRSRRLDRRQLVQGLERASAAIRVMEMQLQELVDSQNAKRTLYRERVDVTRLVNQTVDDFLAGHGADDPEVTVIALPELVAPVNQVRVRRVLWNLLSNAAKFSGPRSRIRVVAEPRVTDGRRFAAVSVHDAGPGIPPADLPHIFERFYRGVHEGDGQGQGLGLYSAKQAVEQHGGAIQVASAPGAGSRFTVLLPADS